MTKSVNQSGKNELEHSIPLLISDVLCTFAAWFLAYYLRFYVLPGARRDSLLFFSLLSVLAVCITIFSLNHNRLYRFDVTFTWQKELGVIAKSTVEVFLAFNVIFYYFFPTKVSRLTLMLYAMFQFVFLLLGRTRVKTWQIRRAAKGAGAQRVLFVGYGRKMNEFHKRETLFSDGLVTAGQYMGDSLKEVPQIKAESLEQAIEKSGANVVVISFPSGDIDTEAMIVRQSIELLGTRVLLLPHLPKCYVGTTITDYHHLPVVNVNSFRMGIVERFCKRAFDIISCTLAVVLLSPLFIIIALLVKCTSKGPVFFKQKRVTRDGEIFTMLKFRSMRVDMPEGDVHWTVENDPRVTRIGNFLRKTSLDEIPQFFNVIGGSMSLIGPRPERPELEEKFIETIPGYNMRHRMKAGISGWAQVNGLRGNTSLTRRIDFDLFYIRNWSMLFDLKIVFMTFFKGFVNKNAY